MKLKYLTHDKIDIDSIQYSPYLCEDMSVKQSEKKYKKCNKCIKDDPKFGYIHLNYYKNPQLYITTPKMKCLFGIQGSNGNFNMSLQFTDLQENQTMKSFYDFIQRIEFEIMQNIGLNVDEADRFVSQIKHDKKGIYEPNLSVKIPFNYNRFQTDIYSDDYSAVNLFQIQNFTNVQCDIFLDKIWRINDKFYAKWKCNIIHLL